MIYKVTLKDKTYEVQVERGQAMILDEYAALAPLAPAAPATPVPVAVAPSAPAAAAVAAGETVTSPMPGSILRINVTQGQKVAEGDVLMVLEAMKMENEVVATKSGTVAQICTSKGATVETGAALAVIA